MSAPLLLSVMLAYFGLLFWVAHWSARGAGNREFFVGARSSHWGLVAFGMIGTSLSGVTFISVPGAVGAGGFAYLQIALGQFIGYAVIAAVLLPLYYRLQLSSIYGYLQQRLGESAYRTGAAFFIVSRTLGATARLYLVVKILQELVLGRLGLSFEASALLVLLMILAYTLKGGVKTLVWTDTLQTAAMLAGLVVCVLFILQSLGLGAAQALDRLDAAGLSRVFVLDPDSPAFFAKQIVAGIFIAIAMSGMDQEMMQKNISVRRLADSQKNMLVMSTLMLGVVLLFLFLGGLLQLFALDRGLGARGDALFAAVVMEHLPGWVQLVFLLALISALFPSADGAITALTSSFCIDLLDLQRRADWDEARRRQLRQRVHLGFAALFLLLVLVFRWIDDPSMIGLILKLAGYTYGPLLGLFAFGLLTRRALRGPAVPWVALAAPLLCALLESQQARLLGSYRIGLELLLINGLTSFALLYLVSRPGTAGADSTASISTRQPSA